MPVTLPTLSNQFPNVIVRTAHHLTAFIDTVAVEPYSWAYISDGEWVELDATLDKYKVPGAGAVPAAVDLAAKTLYFVTGKTAEPPRQAMTREVEDSSSTTQEGYLPVYKGHEPVEVDSKIYDPDAVATWATVGVAVYVVSMLDGDGNARAVLSTDATGDGGTSGLAIGTLIKNAANNNGFVRVQLT